MDMCVCIRVSNCACILYVGTDIIQRPCIADMCSVHACTCVCTFVRMSVVMEARLKFEILMSTNTTALLIIGAVHKDSQKGFQKGFQKDEQHLVQMYIITYNK